MSESLGGLSRKIHSADDLQTVVRSMKSLAAASIGQYEKSVVALKDYERIVELCLSACLRHRAAAAARAGRPGRGPQSINVIAFGSDQGLVGQFNDVLADAVLTTMTALPGAKKIWVVGERLYARLLDSGLQPLKFFRVPISVGSITPLVGQMLTEISLDHHKGDAAQLLIFHNHLISQVVYAPVHQRLLPLDALWAHKLSARPWPTRSLPEVVGAREDVLKVAIQAYLFVSLFKACAQSLAAENSSRLIAMQRAQTNIEDLLGEFNQSYRRLRQTAIDEELFDVLAGYESLNAVSGATGSGTQHT